MLTPLIYNFKEKIFDVKINFSKIFVYQLFYKSLKK